ncbi:isochorismatase family protein [Scenedesmus sp. NREL 46B-D3]|nr:isochorismatase family protein [Scenedesmus sp. NREL 46B-D3]
MKGVNKFNLGLAVMLALWLAANCQGSEQRSFAKQQVKENRISANNSVLLLLDHQTGLFQLVKDDDVYSFKNNVLALAATAKLYGMPTILTTSLEQGPNGPLLPELRAMLPNTTFIPRPGEINAWDNTDFVNAVKATGRKKLLLAGIVTDVCVLFPTLSALAEGYEVYVVVDASGTFNEAVRDAALGRAQQAGAVLINWFAVACELQKDWRLPPRAGAGLAELLAGYLPQYGNLISSHTAASGSA